MIRTGFPQATTKKQIENALGYIPVGGQGVNLITGTKDFSGDGWDIPTSWIKEGETYNGLTVYSHKVQWVGIRKIITPDAGIYTFSLYAKTESPTEIRIYTTNGNPDTSYFTSTQEWKRYYHTFETSGSKEIVLRLETTVNIRLYVCGYKLERGLVVDPIWTPSPEDVVIKSELENVTGIINASNSSFQETLKGRTNRVTYLTFNNASDNPFSFGIGFAIAFHIGARFDSKTFLLVGFDAITNKNVEVRRFTFTDADEPSGDMEIN